MAAKQKDNILYSKELAMEIIHLIANSDRGPHYHCRMNPDRFPTGATFYKWLDDHADEILKPYEQARKRQAEYMLDQIPEIVDDDSGDVIIKENKSGDQYETMNHEFVARSRLRMDGRLAVAGRLHPRKYGNKTTVGFEGEDGEPVKEPTFHVHFEGPEDDDDKKG